MSKKELIDLCKAGDKQALTLLYKTYAHKMMKICCRYVADKQMAQDLLHDGFIIIFSSINTLRSAEKLEGWMGTIMRNICLKYLKQCNATTTIPLEEIKEEEEPVDSLSTNDFPPYETMLEMVESLPEGYGKVFKLAVLEGLSHKEISLLMGIAPHSSSSQLSRAKNMLRELISHYRMGIGLLIVLSVLLIKILLYNPKRTDNTEKAVSVEKTILMEKSIHTEKRIEPKEGKEKQEQKSFKTFPLDSVQPGLHPVHSLRYAQNKSMKEETIEKVDGLKDSVTSQKDSIQSIDYPARKNQTIEEEKEFYRISTSDFSSGKKKEWSLALNGTGGENRTNIHSSTIPSDNNTATGVLPKETKEKTYHHIPLTFSLSLSKQMNERWAVETGVRYTYLRSDFTIINDLHTEKTQKIHYVGIPLKGSFHIWGNRKLSVYTSAGIALDIPVKSYLEEVVSENKQITDQRKSTLHPSVQWSANWGVGIQYQLTPSVGIYTEPNLNYYFNNENSLNTIRKEQPFNITLPLGIRFSW